MTEVSNYSDPVTETFFLRCVFDGREMTVSHQEFAARFQALAEDMGMEYSLRPLATLPGFKGARPYHQAYERGVKVIGATAHYVTSDLNEGPIIVQEVRSIDHQVSIEQMVHLGHDIEATALSQAVRLHCEQRAMLNGQRTVIL